MTQPPRSLFTRAPAIVLAVAALLIAAASTAVAHDSLTGTSPAAGSTTAVVPARVTLSLSEPALAVGTIVIVTGPAGPVQTGRVALVDTRITQRLRPGSPAGRYTVAWRATSADGHPVSGRFSFTAARASPAGTTPTASPPAPTTPATATAAASAPASSTASSPTAGDSGSPSAWWWLAAGGVVGLLLLGILMARRNPRSTPEGERDPRS